MASRSAHAAGARPSALPHGFVRRRAHQRPGHLHRWAAVAAPGASSSLALGSKLKGVLWDMDGTLSDSEAIHFKAYQAVFARSFPDFEPNPMTKKHYADNMQGRTKTDVLLGLFPHYSDEERGRVALALEAEYEALSKAELRPLRGLTRLMDSLDARSVRHAVVTNAPKSEMMYSLSLLGVRERFDQLVPSEECAASKPDPAPYLEGLKRLGLSAGEAIAVEDSPAGVRSAVAAGLFVVGVTTTKTAEELMGCGAGMCVGDYEDEALWERVSEWTR
uniref:Uncharacterized protein n=1 Tax=Hemiselmis tepida TaxID=464990 RepID=A0A7S0Z4J1_9CRYP|mmetsp:Transcript_8383/g.21712  ORF Transcript_8383/g.21712 Transcript_8383/m.21712 type:complete len:276 (+) Transcript_8383:1132-1959(+)